MDPLVIAGVAGSGFAVGLLLRGAGRQPSGPPGNPGLRYPTPTERDARFGPLAFTATPTERNPEAVTMQEPPPLETVDLPELGARIRVHRAAAPSLRRVFEDLRRAGRIGLITRFSGSYVPRYVRGSTKTLSAHSYGTAVDLNADRYPQGTSGDADQWELARFFARRGWYWGGWFSPPDPHHFEFV